jgi:hypothetical protein
MHDDLLAHQTGITKALHDLTQQHHNESWKQLRKVLHAPRKH